MANGPKIFRKNPEAVKCISGKQTIVYCRSHTLVFSIRKAWPQPIRACEIDELSKASMVELLVTKQDPNSCDQIRSGKSPTNLEAMSLNY